MSPCQCSNSFSVPTTESLGERIRSSTECQSGNVNLCSARDIGNPELLDKLGTIHQEQIDRFVDARSQTPSTKLELKSTMYKCCRRICPLDSLPQTNVVVFKNEPTNKSITLLVNNASVQMFCPETTGMLHVSWSRFSYAFIEAGYVAVHYRSST